MAGIGAYCIAEIGGDVGMFIGPVCIGIGVCILLLSALNACELHHEKFSCCAKSTLERMLVWCYGLFTVITLAIAVWILTSQSTLLAAAEDLCDQPCLNAIIATFSTTDSSNITTGNHSAPTMLLLQHNGGNNRTAAGTENSIAETNRALAKEEFLADLGAKINDTGWFLLLAALFLVLQTLLNFGHMRCISMNKEKHSISRESVPAANALLFEMLDKDGDGSVTKEEMLSALGEEERKKKKVFKMLDKDGDGSVTKEEMRSALGEKKKKKGDRDSAAVESEP